ncbi:alanyl-tRNA editing protein [Neobacillus piezotolerans]|uniref:Alanyl-tRNA editing protein n=1 Tax=Neobacillus piezotolerans TaxID=2259171 RepID=A0A3D8GMT4_9BACI|nr:alanine--tRNA ligase-related protein [Neobacillus piezotolerans]RDU35773.1 alanyl-tRNA editing protein [Neobacillus piezotolerans]
MTRKLYYENPYLTSFDTRLIKQGQDENGDWYAVLEKTAFYPEGGGQPYDTGELNDSTVTKVEEVGGEIRHYLRSSVLTEDGYVEGKIDWERRFDHMQQHTGQHILSAAFDNLFGFKTVAFHLGREESTIDLDTDTLNTNHIEEAEKLANQIVLENRRIETKWVTKEEAEKLPLRKALSVEENIRLVVIPDYDYNGCGGTHPSSTCEAGMIKILGIQKEKKKYRVCFVAGNRSFRQFSKKNDILARLTPLLNAPQDEMETALHKLLETKNALEKKLEEANDRLIDFEASQMRTNRGLTDIPVTGVFENRPIQELQKLARAIVGEGDGIKAILLSKNGDKLQFVCAKGRNTSGNMKEAVAVALPLINGKGGGNETFAQGGGEALIRPEELLKELLAKI